MSVDERRKLEHSTSESRAVGDAAEQADSRDRPADLPQARVAPELAENVRGGFKSETFPLD